MTTTTEVKARRPRRTHDDIRAEVRQEMQVEAERAMALEREAVRMYYEQAYQLLSKHDSALLLEVHWLREQLANISLRRLAWQRIKGLFTGYGRSESNNELFDDWGKK